MSHVGQVISSEAEINTGYCRFKLRRGQFNLSQPYQRVRDDACSTRDPSGSQTAEPPANRKRKRNSNEDGTEPSKQQHADIVEIIQAAHAALCQAGSLEPPCAEAAAVPSSMSANISNPKSQCSPLISTSTVAAAGASCNQQTGLLAADIQSDDDPCTNQQHDASVDWVALSSLRFVVKPKISLPPMPDASSAPTTTNLFHKVIHNSCATEVVAMAHNIPVLLPAQSKFLMSDVQHLAPVLTELGDTGADLVVMDPPWENASVKRSKKYSTMTPKQLRQLPIKRLLSKVRRTCCYQESACASNAVLECMILLGLARLVC